MDHAGLNADDGVKAQGALKLEEDPNGGGFSTLVALRQFRELTAAWIQLENRRQE